MRKEVLDCELACKEGVIALGHNLLKYFLGSEEHHGFTRAALIFWLVQENSLTVHLRDDVIRFIYAIGVLVVKMSHLNKQYFCLCVP